MNWKNKKIQYFLFLICLHSACIFFTISQFLFPDWGRWLLTTRFLSTSFSVYIAMIICVFPLLGVFPYYCVNTFPHVPLKKKIILAALVLGNELAVLTYNALIYYWMGD